jgi:hypothetical protein
MTGSRSTGGRQRFWHEQRSRRVAIATLLAVACGVAASHVVATRGDSAVQSGDFPVFHAVGRLVVSGRTQAIYDLAVLQQQQLRDWPSIGTFFPFAYPAFFAAPLAPLGLLPPAVAKGLFSFLMLGFTLVALALGRRLLPPGSAPWPMTLALALTLVPLDLAVFGGQNTGLSLLLWASAAIALRRGDRRGEILAGVLLGLWLFKPHFGLLAIGLTLAARRWRVLLGALPVALLLYAVGALLYGSYWIADWLGALEGYRLRDDLANQHQMVCLIGTAHAVAAALALPQPAAQILVGAGWASSALVVACCARRLWCTSGSVTGSTDRSAGCSAPFALIGPVAVLASPHTVIYDLPLALLPALLGVRFERDREVHAVALLWIAVAICTLVKDRLAVQPLVVVILGVVLWMARSGSARWSNDRFPT